MLRIQALEGLLTVQRIARAPGGTAGDCSHGCALTPAQAHVAHFQCQLVVLTVTYADGRLQQR